MKKWIAILVFGCAACAISPEPDYFILTQTKGEMALSVKENIRIQRPQLARYLDQPEFVYQIDSVQIKKDDSRYWAEPLDVMVERILAADLQQRLPASHVVTENTDTTTDREIKVALDIQHFNYVNHDHAVFQANLLLHSKAWGNKNPIFPVNLEVDTASSGKAIADSMSDLVGRLADKIVEVIGSEGLARYP